MVRPKQTELIKNNRKIQRHIGKTVGSYNSSYKEFKKIDKDIVRVSGGKSSIDPMLIDRPQEYDEGT